MTTPTLRRHLAALALLTALTGAPARAQDVDILSQDLAVDLTEPQAMGVSVHALVRATAPTEALYLLVPAIPIVSTAVDGVPVTLEPHPMYPDQVTVLSYPEPLEAGDEVAVDLELSGAPACASAYQPGYIACRHGATESFLTPSNAWYLYNLFESDAFVGEVSVRVPAGHEVVAGQGAPLEVLAHDDGTVTWRFAYARPTENLGLYAGAVDVLEAATDFPVRGLYHRESAAQEGGSQEGRKSGFLSSCFPQRF